MIKDRKIHNCKECKTKVSLLIKGKCRRCYSRRYYGIYNKHRIRYWCNNCYKYIESCKCPKEEQNLRINKPVKFRDKKSVKRYNRWYTRQKRLKDKNFNLTSRIRCRFKNYLKKYLITGEVKTSSEYGINYKSIIEYLKPFPEDISKYHIDHIIPLSSFKFIKEDGSINYEEIQKAFAPENHQWLLAKENIRKSNKFLITNPPSSSSDSSDGDKLISPSAI